MTHSANPRGLLKSWCKTFNWLRSSLNFILMPHILPTPTNETIGEEIGEITILYFTMPWSGPLSHQKCYEMLYGTQIRRDNFMSVVHPLLSFLLSMVEDRGIFFFDNFNKLCLWLNWYCANKWRISFPKQKLFLCFFSLWQ